MASQAGAGEPWQSDLDAVLSFFVGLPPLLIYFVLGTGSALENIVPPIPADTFVLWGGFLSALGRLDAPLVFLVTWSTNVMSALAVYWISLAHGPSFFQHGWGRLLLNHHQMERMRLFHEKWGVVAIFLTRFLPGLRAMAPAVAGVSRLAWWRVAPPVAVASAIWYGALVWLGSTAGSHLDEIKEWVDQANLVLLVIAAVVFCCAGLWWWRSRRHGLQSPS
jgi:membrane protein DedA with SNARE-associated domain